MAHPQSYVDLLTINYTQSNAASYVNSPEKSALSNFELALTIPIIINDKYVFITGVDFNKNAIQLSPTYSNNSLFLTRLKVGLGIKYSEKWSGTFLLLPKVASDYINVTTNDLYLGGAVVFKYKKKENLNYKLGMYASNEAYGLFVSPLLGMYYKSPNSKFEMNITLPTDLDLNYSATQKTKIGIDYSAVGKSYRITTENTRNSYAENNSLQFSTYIQNNSLFKNILFRIKAGFSTNAYEVYPINQKNDFRVSAFKFGDHRTKINTILSGSPFIMFESIYRFDIPSK
jgi:hypothetical protein